MLDFRKFILDNGIVNLETLRKNGNKTGKSTRFYAEHEGTFQAIFEKHGTDNLLEAVLLEFGMISKRDCLMCKSPTNFSERNRDYLQCCSKMCQSKLSNTTRTKTYLKKYGASHPMRNDAIKEKQINTNLERHGVANVFQSTETKNKIKETNLHKYGVEHSSQRTDFIEKLKRTNNERYGVDFPAQSKKIQGKISNTLIEIYGANTHQPIANYQDLNADFITETLVNDSGQLEIDTVLEHFQCSRNFWVTKIRPLVAGKIAIKKARGNEQNKIADYIRELYNGIVIQDDRKELGGLELDIYVPDKKFAIEYNGTYWHSFTVGDDIDKNRHVQKTQMCEERDIQLFHIWEHDWKNEQKKVILKSMISNKLGINSRLYARNCEIRELDSSTADTFCKANHIQGEARSSVRYGLFHNDDLVFVITFGVPRFNKEHKWELIRSCSLLGHTVVGGFQKLLKHFMINYKGAIISYANRNYSDGNVYKLSGFTELNASPPAQSYWKSNTDIIIKRYQAQKHKLEKLLETYDPDVSEQENMLNNGYRVMWDCGNKVFSYGKQER